MAAVSPAGWQESGSNRARQARLAATGDVLSSGVWGAINATASPLKVTGTGTATATVAAGGCYVNAATGQGFYACYNDADVAVAIPAQGAGSARTDLIVARVYDTNLGDAGPDRWVIERVDGTTGAPAVPATPTRSFVLARVTVNASGSTIASIADWRLPFRRVGTAAFQSPPGATGNVLEIYDAAGNLDLSLSVGGVLTADVVPLTALMSRTDQRNRVLNGDFSIWQRFLSSTTSAGLVVGTYGFDRWKAGSTGANLTFTLLPAGIGNIVTMASGDRLLQVIPREDMPAGTYRLAHEGTASIRGYNSGGSAPAFAASPLTVTVDGLADYVVELEATGGSRTAKNVQLRMMDGPTGTPPASIPFAKALYADELTACQRFYYKWSSELSTLARAGTGQCQTTTTAAILVPFPVTMRATPAADSFSAAATWAVTNVSGGLVAVTAIVQTSASPHQALLTATVASGLVAGNASMLAANSVTTARLGFTAEI